MNSNTLLNPSASLHSRRSVLIKTAQLGLATLASSPLSLAAPVAHANTRKTQGTTMLETIKPASLALTQEWDKIFPKSNKVTHRKVTFMNRFGLTLAADLYMPKELSAGKHAAIAVSGPFGAVKEQSSGFHAQTLAERGWITIAFDPAFTGESGGFPHNIAAGDINTEDFSAAVDFLVTLPEVDENRIGILGICGWGGMALNAATVDPRIRATVTTTMYDMSRVMSNGYNDVADSAEARQAQRKAIAEIRTKNAKAGTFAAGTPGLPETLKGDEAQFVKDYWEYYKTPRGFHARSINSNGAWNPLTPLSFINMPLLRYIDEIETPVLMLHGEKAHSRYFSEDAFKRLKGTNKELYIVAGANHTDLYDKKVPFEKIDAFYASTLGR